MKTKNEMIQLLKDGKLSLLTVEAAKELKSKRISTIYFGYNGQDGVDEFIVGDIVSDYDLAEVNDCEGYNNRAEYWESFMSQQQLEYYKSCLSLLRADGTNTHFGYSPDDDWEKNRAFHCSDVDRYVFYIVCE